MFERSLTIVALVLGATSLAAQAPNQKPAAKPPAPAQQTSPYVPAIMQPRMVTLDGCLEQKGSYILTQATIPGATAKDQAEPAPASAYALEGLAAARLSMLVGQRVSVTGVYQSPATKDAASAAPARFEATNIVEAEGTCPAS